MSEQDRVDRANKLLKLLDESVERGDASRLCDEETPDLPFLPAPAPNFATDEDGYLVHGTKLARLLTRNPQDVDL